MAVAPLTRVFRSLVFREVFRWRQVFQGIEGTLIVVFRHQGFGQFSDFGEVPEDVHIEDLVPITPIEALKIRVLSG